MAIDSIEISIKTKVEGYQSEIEKIKLALQTVGERADIGKELRKLLSLVERQVDSLSKKMLFHVSSDRGLMTMMDRLNNVDSEIASIGRKMQQIEVGDVDTSAVDEIVKGLQELIEELSSSIRTGIAPAFSEAVKLMAKDADFSEVFKLLQIDPSKLNLDNFSEVLSEGISRVKQEATALLEEIDALALQKQALELAFGGYGNDMKLDVGKITELARDALALIGDTTQLSSSAQALLATLQSLFNRAFTDISTDAKALLDQIFATLSSSTDLAVFREELAKIPTILRNGAANGGRMTNERINQALKSAGSGQDLNRLISIDNFKGQNVEALERVRNVVESLFSTFLGFKDSDALKAQVDTLMQSFLGGAADGITAVVQAILQYIEVTARAKLQDLSGTITATNLKMAELGDQGTKLTQAQSSAENMKSALEARVASMQETIKRQLTEIEALKKQVASLSTDAHKNIRATGRQIELAGKGGLEKNSQMAKDLSAELTQALKNMQALGKVEGVVQRWFSIYAVIRMVGQAINSIKTNLKDLDKTITEIAIVTNMTLQQLWGLMDTYTTMARLYAASISGVYQVSLLYYQQGLQTADVMALTEQTLKMARISGLDYAKATDYMTNAIRSFKMEMTDAERVVDVYSALAASAATNVQELAVAMSKTASSAEAVGSSFENTSAMMAVMIEATRESSLNIGSALKSIISRYGELKVNPSTLVDSEGEELSLNKVDTALQSVGISLHNAEGQFRDFDDVIIELAKSWDTIDVNTQRYIATVMAGNRQQSRFLALVSNYERLKELTEVAADSEDASLILFLKTLDSIGAKALQVLTSLLSLYTSAGLEELYKSVLTFENSAVKSLNEMNQALGTPIPALIAIGTRFYSLASIAKTAFELIKSYLQKNVNDIKNAQKAGTQDLINDYERDVQEFKEKQEEKTKIAEREILKRESLENGRRVDTPDELAEELNAGYTPEMSPEEEAAARAERQAKIALTAILAANVASLVLSTAATNLKASKDSRQLMGGGILSTLSSGLSMGAMGASIGLKTATPHGVVAGAAIGGAIGIASGLLSNWNLIILDNATLLRTATEAAEEANNAMLLLRNSSKQLLASITELNRLREALYDSVEAQEAFLEANNTLADLYPELIQRYDETGNAIIDLVAANDALRASLGETTEKVIASAAANYKKALIEERTEKALLKEDYGEVYSFDEARLAMLGLMLGTTRTVDAGGRARFTYGNKENIGAGELLKAEDWISKGEGIQYEFDPATYIYPYIAQEYKDLAKGFFTTNDADLKLWIGGHSDELKRMAEDSNNTLTQAFAEAILEMGHIARDTIPSETEAAEAKTGRQAKAGIAATLNARRNEAIFAGDDLSGKFTGVFEAALQQAYEDWESQTNKSDQAYESFLNNLDYDAYIELINTALASVDKDQFEALMARRGLISESVFRKQLARLGVNHDTIELLSHYYDSLFDIDMFAEAVDNWKPENDTIKTWLTDYMQERDSVLKKLSDSELLSVLNYGKLLTLLIGVTLTALLAGTIFSKYINVYELIENEITDEVARENAEQLLREWDGSREGLEAILNSLIESGAALATNDPVLLAISQLIDELPSNLNTLFQTIYTQIGKASKDFDKDIGKLNKGMSADEAVEMANKYNLQLSDFLLDYSTGLWSISNIQDGVDHYFSELELLLDVAAQEYENTLSAVEGESFLAGQTTDNILDYLLAIDLSSYKDAFYNNLGITPGELKALATQFANSGAKGSFADWLKEYYGGLAEAGEQALRVMEARGSLQVGNVTDFVTYALEGFAINGSNTIQSIIESIIKNGRIDEADLNAILANETDTDRAAIIEELKKYGIFVEETIGDIRSKALSRAIDSMSSGRQVTIDVNQSNELLLHDLDADFSEDGLHAYLTVGNEVEDYFKIRNLIVSDASLEAEEMEKLLLALETARAKHLSIDDTFESIISAGNEGVGEAVALRFATEYGISNDALRGFYDTLENAYIFPLLDLRRIIVNSSTISDRRKNELLALLDEELYKQSGDNAFLDIAKNYSNVGPEAIGTLATALGESYDTVLTYFESNGDGTYKIDLSKLKQLLTDLAIRGNNAAAETIAQIIDAYIDAISNVATIQTEGYTKLEDMQKLADSVGQTIDNIFEWNTELKAYVLKLDSIALVVRHYKDELTAAGYNAAQVELLLNANLEHMAESIDANEYILALGSGNTELILKSTDKFTHAVNSYVAFAEALGKTVNLNADTLLAMLQGSGAERVAALLQIAALSGKVLTGDEIEQAYLADVTLLQEAINLLDVLVGSVINARAAEILEQAGYRVADLGGGKYVVESVGNVIQAHAIALALLRDIDESTIADINAQTGRILEKAHKENRYKALGAAAAMDFSTLESTFNELGIDIQAAILQNIVKYIGNGQYLILDFKGFASALGLQEGTQEYIDAWNSFNETRIKQLDEVTTNLNEEITAISNAKQNLRVNVSYLTSLLNSTLQAIFRTAVEAAGGSFADGILDMGNASAIAILNIFKSFNNSNINQTELLNTIDLLLDTFISSMTDLIGNYSNGYTKISDMLNIAKLLNKSVNEIFRWNEETSSFVLNQEGIIATAAAMMQLLNYASDEQKTIIKGLIEGQKQTLALNIDAFDYISALQTGDNGAIQKAADRFKDAIKAYDSFSQGLGINLTTNSQALLDALSEGGHQAILAAGYIASLQGKELSGEDIEKLYRGQVQPLLNAVELLTLSVGSVIDETTAGILLLAGYGVQSLGGGKAVITSAGNLVLAQSLLYLRLKETNEASLAELNNLFAQYQGSRFGRGNIEKLSNAGGMSYDTLALIATDAGLLLEDLLYDSVLGGMFKDIGGKIQVTNFDFFAKQILGIYDTTSQAYIDAFRNYNDTIIAQINARGSNVKNEISAITLGKKGDLINISQIFSGINFDGQTLSQLRDAGAIISDGILELGTNNVTQVLQILNREIKANQTSLQLSDTDLERIDQAITEYVNNYINNITNNIKNNSLGYTDVAQMQTIADSLNTTVSEIFSWDRNLQAYVLSSDAIGAMAAQAADAIKNLPENLQALARLIFESNAAAILQLVSVADLAAAYGTSEWTDSAITFIHAIDQYNHFLAGLGKQDGFLASGKLLSAIREGGQSAVAAAQAIAKATGQKVSGSDIEAIYRSEVNSINNALDQIGTSVGGIIDKATYELLTAAGGMRSTDFEQIGNSGKFVVKSAIDVVDAYNRIYGALASSGEATLQELNAVEAKILAEGTNKSASTIEALGDAADMSFEALGAIAESMGKDLFWLTTYLENMNAIEYLGGNHARITDFNVLAAIAGFDDTISEYYVETLSAYNDSLIEATSRTSSSIMDELHSVAEAHAGDLVNVTHLYSLFGREIPQEFVSRLEEFGATLKDGILTINDSSYLTEVIKLLTEAARVTGELTERLVAELQDAVLDLISSITDGIKSGIEGTLTNVGKVDLKEALLQYNILLDDTDFTKTAEGWLLTLDAAFRVVDAMQQMESILGNIAFTALAESLEEARFGITDLYAYTTSMGYKTKSGNVDLVLHANHMITADLMQAAGYTDYPDTDYSTLYGSTASASYDTGTEHESHVVILITPITNDGREIESPEDLDAYIDELFQSGTTASEILAYDKSHKNLLIGAQDVANGESLSEALELADQELLQLHNESDILARRFKEISEINLLKATQANDSLDFMNNKLPAALENPLTYAENWGKAIDILTKKSSGTKKGFIDARDWYNIVNEMNHIAGMGENIKMYGVELDGSLEAASELIEKGFSHLKSIDGGEMQVDLSQLGVGFEAGAMDMQGSITRGIHAVAQSLIDMLDGLISVLETIVAMQEAFAGMDEITEDGQLDFGELFENAFIFKPNGEKVTFDNVFQATDEFKTAALRMIDKFSSLEDLKNPLKLININGILLGELLLQAANGTKFTGELAQALSSAMNALYKASLSGNYDLDNIYASVKLELLAAGVTDMDLTIDIGTTTIYLTGDTVYSIDWSSADTEQKIRDAYYGHKSKQKIDEKTRKAAKKAAADFKKNPLSLSGDNLEFALSTAPEVTIKYDDNDKPTYVVEGFYSGPDAEEAAKAVLLKRAGVTGKLTYDGTGKDAKIVAGTIHGSENFDVVIDVTGGKPKYTYTDPDGNVYTGDDLDSVIDSYLNSTDLDYNEGTEEYRTEARNKFMIKKGLKTGPNFEIGGKTGGKPTTGALQGILLFLTDPNVPKTAEGLQKFIEEWNANPDNANKQIDLTIGNKIKGDLTPEQLLELATLFGINYDVEGKTMSINLDTSSVDPSWAELINNKEITVTVKFRKEGEGPPNNGNGGDGGDDGDGETTGDEGNNPLDTNSKGVLNKTAPSFHKMPPKAMLADPFATTEDPLRDVFRDVPEIAEANAGINEYAESLGQVYNKANLLQDFDWADLANKINIFGPKEEGEGGEGDTPTGSGIDVTINPIAEQALLDLIYGETLERNLIVNVLKKEDNLNPTQTEDNNDKNLKENKESKDNTGATLGEANTGGLQAAVDAVNSIATDKGTAILNTTDALNALPDLSSLIKRLSGSIDKILDRSGRIDNLVLSINNLPSSKEIALEISMKIKATADVKFNTGGDGGAKGNIEISNELASVENLNPSKKKIKITSKKKSKAKGTSALAGGTNKTLMGELGPELVVTDNMYHVVGENGAEFVDLPNDAIVFNHLLTKKLLKNGHGGRGKPITNERNAVAFAKGSGPAMASAAQALAALKQLRAMWASMLNASAKDLGSLAGRGGGGGGKDENDKYKQPTNVTAEILRWYNWLRQIDRIEQDITYQEKLQKKYESDRIANGLKIYETLKAQYDLLGEEIKRNQKLAELQKSWYDNKRAELAASSYGKIFTYDEHGLQQYVGSGKPGSGLGLDILENLTRRNVKGEYTGHAVSAKEQLKYLASVGFKLNDLIYNDDGTKVALKVTQSLAIQRILDDESSDDEIFTLMMENFWNNVDGWRDELDSLYDSYRELLTNIEENQTKQYEIIQKFVENELDVENKLLEAIEAREQAVIDKLTELKDALQKSTDRFIKGLNDQLDKEKLMQEDNKKDEELTKLQRLLAILQRSGGSASLIKSLQDQIASKQQDAYYDGRKEEIDAIKDATDKQLEKLDKQIELLTKTLEYLKENGLFWNEVRKLMAGPEDVATAFYNKYVTSESGKSALQQSEDIRSFKESFLEWIGWRENKDKLAEKLAEMEDIANYETYGESNSRYLQGLTEDERSSAITRAETAAEEAKNQYLEDHKDEEGAEEGAKAAAAKAYNESLRTSFVKSEQNKEDSEEFEEGYDTWLKNRYAKNGDEDITLLDVFKNNSAAFKENVKAKYLLNLRDGMERKAALEDAINYGEEQFKLTGAEDAKAAEVQAKLSAKAAVYKINEAKGTAKKTKTTIAKGTLLKFTRAKLAKVGKKKIKFLYAEPIGWIAASNVVDGTELYNKLKNAQDITDASEQIDALSNPLGEEAGENQYYDAAISRKIALSGLSKKLLKFSATKLQDKTNGEMISPLKYGNTILITDVSGLKFNKKGKISKLSKVNVSSLNGSELLQSEWVKANKTIIKKLNAMFPNNDFKNYLKYLNKYKEGGLVDYTGLARVDGTPGRPEAFLNAELTAFLKNDLLGHSSNSLMSIVSSLQDSINGTAVGNSNISNNNNNDNVVIENVDVTFEAGTISSDYDARRAGELFKEELVKMARKAGDRSVTRR